MRSREEIYKKLIEMNEHKDELSHFLNNPPNGGLWGVSEKHHQFETQCSMIDLLEWVLNIKKTKTEVSKIIFTTKDGYDITEGIKYYSVRIKECKISKSPQWSMCGPYINPKAHEPTGDIEYFYNKENAEEFIIQNKDE